MFLKNRTSNLSKTKSKKRKTITYVIACIFFIVGCTTLTTLLVLSRTSYTLVDNPTFEINSKNTVSSLFTEISQGVIENPDIELDTTEIGSRNQTVVLISPLGTKQNIDITYHINDTIPPTITGEDVLSFKITEDINILGGYQANDNSEQEISLSIDGEYDLTVAGEYTIKIIATDKSGNHSVKEVQLIISEPPRPFLDIIPSNSSPYYIEVNREQNVVIVYSKNQDGDFSNIAKVFVASTGAPGSETPLGIFSTTDKYETLFLVGNVWGHYTVRINGPIFFHSVPYFSKGSPWNDLEYLEYNKLGNGASAGCVRLAAIDAKWIYDNIPYGTTVAIYDSPDLPNGVTKPIPLVIDENNAYRGWDPTDPDPNNPWLNQ